MHCCEAREKLDLFAAQEVTSSERAAIEAHLASCAECRAALARLRRLGELLAAWPAPPVAQGFAGRVVARAKQQQTAVGGRRPGRLGWARSAWNRIRFPAATAAALAAGLVLGLWMGHHTWRSGVQRPPAASRGGGDLLAASGLGELAEPGGDSLGEAYLQLITAADR